MISFKQILKVEKIKKFRKIIFLGFVNFSFLQNVLFIKYF